MPALKRTLSDLKLEYLDLYLMHFPVAWPNRRTNDSAYPEDFNEDFRGLQEPIPVDDTWEAMQECVAKGLIKDIGVSNFSTALVWELIKKSKQKNWKYPCTVNQFEMHPFLAQRALIDLCHSKVLPLLSFFFFLT